jgi:Kef-type K+ transport system membrane component KefB
VLIHRARLHAPGAHSKPERGAAVTNVAGVVGLAILLVMWFKLAGTETFLYSGGFTLSAIASVAQALTNSRRRTSTTPVNAGLVLMPLFVACTAIPQCLSVGYGHSCCSHSTPLRWQA